VSATQLYAYPRPSAMPGSAADRIEELFLRGAGGDLPAPDYSDEITLASYIAENSSHVNWGSPASTGFSTTLP